MTQELPEQYGWRKIGTDSFTSGRYELRKLTTGNWVFRHDIKEYAYINIGTKLNADILSVLQKLMTHLDH